MATFVKSGESKTAEEDSSGVRFVKAGSYQAPPMNIESPFWSTPLYGDGTVASLAATRPGQPDQKVGYGEVAKIAGRTGNELAAAATGTIPEFAGEIGANIASPDIVPQSDLRGELEQQNRIFQRLGQSAVATPQPSAPRTNYENPLAGAGAAAREAFGLNIPELQPNPALSPENTPYMDFSGQTPIRNKILRLTGETAGMVPIGAEIAAGSALAGPLGGGAMASLAMSAEKFQQGLDAGKSRQEALNEAALSGVGNTALFAIPVAASIAKFLPPTLASRLLTVGVSGLEMGGKMMATGGVDAATNIDNIPMSSEEWKKAYEDVRDGTWNNRSQFLAGALTGAAFGTMTPIGRAKAQAEAKAALDDFIDLGDATVRQREASREQIGRSGNGLDTQRNPMGRDSGVRFQQQKALSGPALTGPEPQGAITGPDGRPVLAQPRAVAPLDANPVFDPNRQVMPQPEVDALINSLNEQLQARGQRLSVEPIPGGQGALGLPPGAERGPMPDPPPAIPLPPPMGVGRPIEEAPSRRAVAETAPVPAGPAVRPPTPEELALEQQILGADLVDSREIPKPTTPETPKTAKEKILALKEARKQSLIDTTVAQEAPVAPTSPLQSAVEPQTPVEPTKIAPEFSDMVKEAQRWRGAAMNVARSLEGNPREALKHSSQTTKGDLDKYLMNKFGVGPTEARDVSNELTRLNLPDDLTAQPEDFAGEPWAKTTPKPTAEFKGMQPRPRGQSPIPLYNIPDGKGGFTTVSAETAQAQGYDVPEPPKAQTKQPWDMSDKDLSDTGVSSTGIKDESGKPIVFYHGTLNMKPGEPFTGMRLDISPSGSQRGTGGGGADTLGMWFTDDPSEAPYYTRKFDSDTREEAILPAYIKAENPLVFNSPDEYMKWIEDYASFHGGVKPGAGFGTADMNAVRERLALGGKDAIIIKNTAEIGSGKATWAVALKPEAIVASAPVRQQDIPTTSKPTPRQILESKKQDLQDRREDSPEDVKQKISALRKEALKKRKEASDYNKSTDGRAVKNKGRNNIHEMDKGYGMSTFVSPMSENRESAKHTELMRESQVLMDQAKELEKTLPAKEVAPLTRTSMKKVEIEKDYTFSGNVLKVTNIPDRVMERFGWLAVNVIPGEKQKVFAMKENFESEDLFVGDVSKQLIPFINKRLAAESAPDTATIRADIKALASATDRTRLADIREKLPQYDRATLDKELIAMQRDGELVLNRNDDPQDIAARDEAAKLDLNGERRDLVYLTPQKGKVKHDPIPAEVESAIVSVNTTEAENKLQALRPWGQTEPRTASGLALYEKAKALAESKGWDWDAIQEEVRQKRVLDKNWMDSRQAQEFADLDRFRQQREAANAVEPTPLTPKEAIQQLKAVRSGNVEDLAGLMQNSEAPRTDTGYSPETQAIVDAYGGRSKALIILKKQEAIARQNQEEVNPATARAIKELTQGPAPKQEDMFGGEEIQSSPSDARQTQLPMGTKVVAEKVNAEFASAPGSEALSDFRKRVRSSGVRPVKGWGQEEMGYKGEKIPWIKRSGSMTADQWLENALQEGLISQYEVTEPSTIRKLMSGRVDKKVPVQEEGFNVPALKAEPAQATGTTQRIADIMKGMGLTEDAPAKKPVKSIGFTSMFERKEAAGDKFVSSVMEQFGKTKDEAEHVLSYYLQNKLVKLDPVDGQFKLKHGAFWEQGPIDRAVEQPLKQVKGQAKTSTRPVETTSTKATATVPRKVTVNKLLSLVPNDIVYYDSKKNVISFDASQEGITKVQQAMDKALDSVPQTPTAQAKYEEAYGEIMDAVFSKQEDAGTPSSKPKKSKKRGADPTNPEAGVRLRMTSKDFRDGIKEIGRLLMAGAKSKPTIRFTKGLPEYVWDEAIKMHGLATSYTTRMQQAAADLIQGYRKSLGMQGLGKDIPKEMRELGTQYLEERSPAAKQALLRQFPEEMHAPLRRMRALIDEMTEEWIRNDVVSPAKAQTLKANKGAYVTRQYQTFNDPNYRNVIPSLVRERMRGLLRQWYPEIKNDDVLEGLVNEWVDVSEGEGSGLMWRGSPLGARNFDILKKRENWPQEVLDLWGLEKDVIKNALNTAVKQAKPLAATIFQHNVVKHGRENNYLFSREDIADINSGKAPKAKAEAYGKLVANNNGTWMTEAAESNKPGASPYASLGVLGDMYASKDFKKAMHDAMNPTQHVEAIKALIQLNGIAKQALTIESLTTQATNFITNPGFFMGSGLALYDMPGLPGRMKIAAGITMTELKNTSAKSYRDVANRAIQLGVIKEMDNASDISKVVEEGKGGPLSKPAIKLAQAGQRLAHEQKNKAKLALGKAAQLPKYLQDMAAEGRDELVAFYQAGDDFWKALSWLTDTEYQMERNPSLSRAQAEELSAKMIRTYGVPYYSELPSVIQKTRHIPIFNPFGSFPTEAPRILFNQTMQAKGEVFSGNAAETKMAARRFAGQAIAYGIPILTATVSAAMWALSDKDQDTLNDMGPQWDSNSNKAYYAVDRSRGIVKYWNISRASVQSEITDPINALLREEKLSEGTQRALLAVLDPYLQEEIGWKALRQIFENRDDYGRPIWNDADTKSEFAKKIGGVAMGAVQPGTVDSIYRILKDETPVTKLLAEATGQRIRTVDMPKELTYKAKEFMASTRDASMDVKRAEKSGDNAELAEQKRQRLALHKEKWESLHENVSGMKAFGVDYMRIVASLKSGGMSKKNIDNLINGVYLPPESMQ